MLIPFSDLYEKVQLILKNKIEEFHFYGYNALTEQDLWRYCIDKVWRKQDVQNLRLHELASGIFNVTASEVINYIQISDLKQNLFDVDIITKVELDSLFDPKKVSMLKKNEK